MVEKLERGFGSTPQNAAREAPFITRLGSFNYACFHPYTWSLPNLISVCALCAPTPTPLPAIAHLAQAVDSVNKHSAFCTEKSATPGSSSDALVSGPLGPTLDLLGPPPSKLLSGGVE